MDGPGGMDIAGFDPDARRDLRIGDSECVVYFFGHARAVPWMPISRWSGQFTVSGKPAPSKTAKKTIHGLNVTTMDATETDVATGGMAMTASRPGPTTGCLPQ